MSEGRKEKMKKEEAAAQRNHIPPWTPGSREMSPLVIAWTVPSAPATLTISTGYNNSGRKAKKNCIVVVESQIEKEFALIKLGLPPEHSLKMRKDKCVSTTLEVYKGGTQEEDIGST